MRAIPLEALEEKDRPYAGPGAWALRTLGLAGFPIPRTLCITSRAYDEYTEKTGLKERILMELHRKDPHARRWEEIWGASLRIRNMFLNVPMPLELRHGLKSLLHDFFGASEAELRLSAPPRNPSFSCVTHPYGQPGRVAGVYSILERIRLAWAAACTDCTSLAIRDMGAGSQKVAVLVQESPAGGVRGTAFRTAAGGGSKLVIEYGEAGGLGAQGQWALDERTGAVVFEASPGGASPISERELREAAGQAAMAVDRLGPFAEVEWALHQGRLSILHAHPGKEDPRLSGQGIRARGAERVPRPFPGH